MMRVAVAQTGRKLGATGDFHGGFGVLTGVWWPFVFIQYWVGAW